MPLFVVPLLAVGALQIIYNYKPLFFLMVATIPVSLQLEFGSTSVDLPSEPLMLLFLALFLIQLISGRFTDRNQKLYPFHLLIIVILCWTLITTVTSTHFLRSFKFLLSKIWYLAAFVFMAGKFIGSPKDIKKMFWAFFIPFFLLVIGVTARHAAEGFSFESAHLISHPIYANGVIYSTALALFIPWCWFARSWYPGSLQRYLITGGMIFFMIALVLCYKRGAFLIVAMLPVIFQSIRWKAFDKFLWIGVVGLPFLVGYLVIDNNFYQFAPNYKTTVWHQDDFEAHLEATFDGTEISGMERFYRWVAAKNMVAHMPVFGAGPSTFNQVYKKYADAAFRTYVSDNEEQSTTHNYYLMTFSEQGFIGGILFLALCVFMLSKGYRIYHRETDPTRKSMISLALLSLIVILFQSLLNEMIEVDKVGPMFWLNMVILHKLEVWQDERETALEPS
ncbi:O-antigen ligase family protein [Pontibacter sp. G13]|uniref:O-antigen ligase family protein n=1 Tax=Pontibacter sp. G13 TaxID=3074898 RepID=UPI00288AFFBC|nr:O-antigen ligase family protein [Pontibacter sp. G13]WNJ20976.1 O-antigen ligase family protein [Pontibacter sp. G13]